MVGRQKEEMIEAMGNPLYGYDIPDHVIGEEIWGFYDWYENGGDENGFGEDFFSEITESYLDEKYGRDVTDSNLTCFDDYEEAKETVLSLVIN